MTLSVESLNKLYFQFLQLHVAPHLPLPHSEFTQLLTRKTAYEVHRYLEDLMHSPGPSDHFASHSLNGSDSPFASSSSHSPSTNVYQYALPTSADGPTYSEHTHAFNKSIDKKDEDKKGQHSKMGLRRALTGAGFEERSGTYDFKSHCDDTLLPIPGLTQSIGNDSLLPIPSLNQSTSLTQSIGNDMLLPLSTHPSSSSESKGEYGDKGGSGGSGGL